LNNLSEEAVIYSHPRSGLHMLCLGLYIIAGHDDSLPYNEIWGSPVLPAYNHWFEMPIDEASKRFKKHILLLRDYYSLACSKKPPTRPGSAYVQGRFGIEPYGYAEQIRKFDSLKNPKMVVYYEDLLNDNQTYLDVADFLEIEYDQENLDFDYIRTQSKKLYLSSGHISAPKNNKKRNRKQVYELIKADLKSEFLFDKYLGQYKQKDD